MANDAAAAAAIMTIDKFLKGVEDSIADEIVEWYYFTKRKRNVVLNSHGTGVDWLVRTKRGTVEGFAREKRLTPVRKNRNVRAKLTNRGYGMAEMVHKTDLWENGTPERLADILGDTLEGMMGDLFDALGNGFYDVGTNATYGGLGFEGADAALVQAGTYGGITVTTDTAFRGKTGSGSPFNQFSTDPLPALDSAIRTCRAGSEGGRSRSSPDVGFMSFDNWDVVHQTFMRQMRLPRDVKSVNAGWSDNFVYRGVTFYPSDYVDQGTGGGSDLYLFQGRNVELRFPTPKIVNEFRFNEASPLAIYILLIVYGLIRHKLPRTSGRFTLA